MSDNIPVEIQLEIVKHLPVKWVIQYRSVSKTWKSLIDCSDFIIKHYMSGHHTQVQHVLVRYEDPLEYYNVDCEIQCVSIVDDHTFPQQKVSLALPQLVPMLQHPMIIGSSHGLLGLYSGSSRDALKRDLVVLWNISIRKATAVVVPNVREGIYGNAIGFGVCLETNDPKIVKITYVDHRKTKGMEHVTCNPPEIEVFTLSTLVWRSSKSNLPRKSIRFDEYNMVVIDGVFYWFATDSITVDGGIRFYYLIVSFDVTSEEFREVTLPDSFANMDYILSLFKLGESLVVVVEDEQPIDSDYDVWMMKDGVPKSFTKLFTITPKVDASVAGFRKSGDPIFDDLVIDGSVGSYYVYHYVETLLLLDRPNSMVYE